MGTVALSIHQAFFKVLPNGWHLEMALFGREEMSGSDRLILLLLQLFDAMALFVAVPLVYIVFYERKAIGVLSPIPLKDGLELMWAILLVPAFAPFMEQIITWNKEVDLPIWMDSIEQWARSKEDIAAEATESLTNFGSLGEFLLGLVVIAGLAGVGEELLFRGLMLPLVRRITRNWHVAIWFTAILFSAIHMQFYGFVPRMLLGAMFGYLYWWSGNIWVPIVAHFTNNAITVCLLYMHKTGSLTFDPEKMPEMPLPVLLGSAAVGGLVLWRFREKYYVQRIENRE